MSFPSSLKSSNGRHRHLGRTAVRTATPMGTFEIFLLVGSRKALRNGPFPKTQNVVVPALVSWWTRTCGLPQRVTLASALQDIVEDLLRIWQQRLTDRLSLDRIWASTSTHPYTNLSIAGDQSLEKPVRRRSSFARRVPTDMILYFSTIAQTDWKGILIFCLLLQRRALFSASFFSWSGLVEASWDLVPFDQLPQLMHCGLQKAQCLDSYQDSALVAFHWAKGKTKFTVFTFKLSPYPSSLIGRALQLRIHVAWRSTLDVGKFSFVGSIRRGMSFVG